MNAARRALVLGLWAAGATAAHATGGIGCTSADGRTRVDLRVSLTQEGVGGGITGLALTGGGAPANWTVTAARADYAAHTARVAARDPARPAQVLRLEIRQARGTLRQGGRQVRLACDWGEFS